MIRSLLFPFILLFVSCGKVPPQEDLRRDWDASELVVVAKVQPGHDGQRQLIAQEVIKGRLGPEVRFSIGTEIGPRFSPSQELPELGSRMIMFYRQAEGTLMCMASFSGGGDRSLLVDGRKYDMSEAIDALRKKG
jgi:hypothetical protein